jgi:hypothetical protein
MIAASSCGFVAGIPSAFLQKPCLRLDRKVLTRRSTNIVMGYPREEAKISRKGFLIQSLFALQIGMVYMVIEWTYYST